MQIPSNFSLWNIVFKHFCGQTGDPVNIFAPQRMNELALGFYSGIKWCCFSVHKQTCWSPLHVCVELLMVGWSLTWFLFTKLFLVYFLLIWNPSKHSGKLVSLLPGQIPDRSLSSGSTGKRNVSDAATFA